MRLELWRATVAWRVCGGCGVAVVWRSDDGYIAARGRLRDGGGGWNRTVRREALRDGYAVVGTVPFAPVHATPSIPLTLLTPSCSLQELNVSLASLVDGGTPLGTPPPFPSPAAARRASHSRQVRAIASPLLVLRSCPHAHALTRMHAHTHTHARTTAHTHTHTRTRTHSHAHAPTAHVTTCNVRPARRHTYM